MATPQERLEADVKTAMKARDKERLGTLRMLLTDVKNEKIQLGADVDESTFITVVRRGIKRRRDAEKQYRDGNRPELADQEAREAVILEEYLPAQVDEATIRAAIEEVVAAENLEGPRGMGPIMKAMKARFGDNADGATLSRLAREVLGS